MNKKSQFRKIRCKLQFQNNKHKSYDKIKGIRFEWEMWNRRRRNKKSQFRKTECMQ